MSTTKGLIIGYCSLCENIIRGLIGAVILIWKAHKDGSKDASNVTTGFSVRENFFEDTYAFLGFIGIFCSAKLIEGVTTASAKKMLWWIFFQWASILHQIFVSLILVELMGKSDDVKHFKPSATIFLSFFSFLQVYSYLSVVKLSISYRQDECSQSSNQRTTQQLIDKPPSYEEATAACPV